MANAQDVGHAYEKRRAVSKRAAYQKGETIMSLIKMMMTDALVAEKKVKIQVWAWERILKLLAYRTIQLLT